MGEQTKKDYETAYQVAEQMGLGYTIRSCECGQCPCSRLVPIMLLLSTQREKLLYALDGLNTIRNRDEFGICDFGSYVDIEQVRNVIKST